MNGENREYFRFSLGALFLAGLGAAGVGISYCAERNDQELEKQYHICQELLEQAQSEESQRFVYDQVIAVQGQYKGQTCRDIIDNYQKRQQ